jgi:putative NAD(P)-binding protein
MNPAAALEPFQAWTSAGPIAAVFVLGCYDNYVTILSQQMRAMNLAWALVESGLATPRRRPVAVVGCGIAGVTLASALASRGVRSVIFERRDRPIPLQQYSQRFVHPHALEWPEPTSAERRAILPLLDWRASQVQSVAAGFIDHFNALVADGRAEFVPNTHVIGLQQLPEGVFVHYRGSDRRFQAVPFECGVLAVGFGVDARHLGRSSFSYWDNDNYLRPFDADRPTRFLVTGTGDGGLVEVFRLRIDGFNHDKIIRLVTGIPGLATIGAEMQGIERESESVSEEKVSAWLDAQYRNRVPIGPLAEALRGQLRADTSVILNGRGPSPFTRRASLFNRYVLHALKRIDGDLTYLGGECDLPSITNNGQGTTIDIVQSGARKRQVVDHLLVRHGPISAIDGLTINEAAITARPASQQHMGFEGHWPEGYFSRARPTRSGVVGNSDLQTMLRDSDTIVMVHRSRLLEGKQPPLAQTPRRLAAFMALEQALYEYGRGDLTAAGTSAIRARSAAPSGVSFSAGVLLAMKALAEGDGSSATTEVNRLGIFRTHSPLTEAKRTVETEDQQRWELASALRLGVIAFALFNPSLADLYWTRVTTFQPTEMLLCRYPLIELTVPVDRLVVKHLCHPQRRAGKELVRWVQESLEPFMRRGVGHALTATTRQDAMCMANSDSALSAFVELGRAWQRPPSVADSRERLKELVDVLGGEYD